MLLKADAAQLEWRCLSWLANDALAIQEILSGSDFHSDNQRLFNLPSRLIAKIYLFRTIYRGSGWSFAHDPQFTHVSSDPDFWDDLNSKFYLKYKGINKCHQKWAQLSSTNQPIISPLGREWLIPIKTVEVTDKRTGLVKSVSKLQWTVFTNYPVQGTGADLMALARVSLKRRLLKGKYSSLLVSTVHDDIKLDCPNEEVEEVGQLVYQVFDDIPSNLKKLWGIQLPIPFPCEVVVDEHLAEMSPLDKKQKQ